jgi:hypothetical protein
MFAELANFIYTDPKIPVSERELASALHAWISDRKSPQ